MYLSETELINSSLISGIGLGAGSEIGHRAISGLMGGGGHDHAVPQEQAQPQQQQQQFHCVDESNSFTQCLQRNNDIASCQIYMDSLKECQKKFQQ